MRRHERRYRCHLTWGRRGLREAALRGDIVVVVDVLSFSTSVATAVQRGGIIVPCAPDADTAALAAQHSAVVAVHRHDVPALGRFSLSPASFLAVANGDVVVLPSPNGGLCSALATNTSFLFAGALVNATSVGHTVSHLVETTDQLVTIVAAGERYDEPSDDGAIRFAVEDYLGAGAIVAAIDAEKSPEAQVCESAFAQVRHRVGEVLWGCESGLELRERGFKNDVRIAAELDAFSAAPILAGGRFVPWTKPEQKVLAYVTRHRDGRAELLVIEHADHPDAGVQVPAGSLEEGEDPEWCALREVREETGLGNVDIVRHLTTRTLFAPWSGTFHERHVYHLELAGDAAERWSHVVSDGRDDRGLRFECRWHDLSEALELAGRQGEYLEYLLT